MIWAPFKKRNLPIGVYSKSDIVSTQKATYKKRHVPGQKWGLMSHFEYEATKPSFWSKIPAGRLGLRGNIGELSIFHAGE